LSWDCIYWRPGSRSIEFGAQRPSRRKDFTRTTGFSLSRIPAILAADRLKPVATFAAVKNVGAPTFKVKP
jgi:hypothetical protein